MTRENLVKALNKIQLLLCLGESGLLLARNEGDVKDRMIICDATAKLLERPLSKENKDKLKIDECEYEIWCYTRLYEGVGYFEDVCSNILMAPELLKDYPQVFGSVFLYAGRIQNRYLDGVKQLEQVASILVLCEKYISDENLEEFLRVFMIEEKCYDVLAKIPRLSKYFESVPSEEELMYINLMGAVDNGTVN